MFWSCNKGTNQSIHSITACCLNNIRKPYFSWCKRLFFNKCLTERINNILYLFFRHHSPVKWKSLACLCHYNLFFVFKTSIAPFSTLVLYKQSSIIILFHALCKLKEPSFILFFSKDFSKFRECYRIGIKKGCLNIFSCKLIIWISPITKSVIDKTIFILLCLKVLQISFAHFIIISNHLFISVKKIMPFDP